MSTCQYHGDPQSDLIWLIVSVHQIYIARISLERLIDNKWRLFLILLLIISFKLLKNLYFQLQVCAFKAQDRRQGASSRELRIQGLSSSARPSIVDELNQWLQSELSRRGCLVRWLPVLDKGNPQETRERDFIGVITCICNLVNPKPTN